MADIEEFLAESKSSLSTDYKSYSLSFAIF